jgi:hypothetical protein
MKGVLGFWGQQRNGSDRHSFVAAQSKGVPHEAQISGPELSRSDLPLVSCDFITILVSQFPKP